MFVAGADAAGRFIDSNVVMREGSMPPHVQIVRRPAAFPCSTARSIARASPRYAGLHAHPLAAYLPVIQTTVERYFEQWSKAGEIGWLDEMKRLAIEVICETVIGIKPGQEVDRLRRDYGMLTAGFATLPINIPGTRYHKALRARDRILDVLRACVRDRRKSPKDDGVADSGRGHGLRHPLSDEDGALEANTTSSSPATSSTPSSRPCAAAD